MTATWLLNGATFGCEAECAELLGPALSLLDTAAAAEVVAFIFIAADTELALLAGPDSRCGAESKAKAVSSSSR